MAGSNLLEAKLKTNPLRDWKVDRRQVTQVGSDLKRPECVLAEPAGDLWVADARGGVMRARACTPSPPQVGPCRPSKRPAPIRIMLMLGAPSRATNGRYAP